MRVRRSFTYITTHMIVLTEEMKLRNLAEKLPKCKKMQQRIVYRKRITSRNKDIGQVQNQMDYTAHVNEND